MSIAEELPTGLKQSHRSWVEAVNETDLDAYANLVSEDVVWIPPGQAAIQGRIAFADWLKPFFARYHYEFTIADPSVRVAGDWAVEKGNFRSQMIPRSGGNAMDHRGQFIVLWLKDTDSVWRIDRYVDDTPTKGDGG
ncbi:MAG: SgcJ/EcaC family oxidoreductase [Dehalococcoidia bacterium]